MLLAAIVVPKCRRFRFVAFVKRVMSSTITIHLVRIKPFRSAALHLIMLQVSKHVGTWHHETIMLFAQPCSSLFVFVMTDLPTKIIRKVLGDRLRRTTGSATPHTGGIGTHPHNRRGRDRRKQRNVSRLCRQTYPQGLAAAFRGPGWPTHQRLSCQQQRHRHCHRHVAKKHQLPESHNSFTDVFGMF